VLVADDEPSIRFVLREILEESGCQVAEAADGNAAREALASEDFQLAFLDIRMPGPTGLDLLDAVRAQEADTAVVIITAQNTFENAVEAMKRGALDYLVKPFGIAEVKAIVARVLRTRALERELDALRRERELGAAAGQRLVGNSSALLEIFKAIGRLAARDISVLITGESGTGKELVAQAIHAAGPRAERPFVAVNTAAIPRDLMESELFGHELGAFTGAVAARTGHFREASGGTLFLDEIGDMSMDLQAKLLRVLQDREVTPIGGSAPQLVDVRIIAATHCDLDAAVGAGTFREDLLYRLRVVPLHIPPLRERREDIPVLAEHFVDRYGRELAETHCVLADAALERLLHHDWPGNVRELENAVKRALVLSSSGVLAPDDFAFLEGGAASDSDANLAALVRSEVTRRLEAGEEDVYRRVIERVERPLLEAVLARTEGNQIRAAALLGINRNTLRKKIAELGIRCRGAHERGHARTDRGTSRLGGRRAALEARPRGAGRRGLCGRSGRGAAARQARHRSRGAGLGPGDPAPHARVWGPLHRERSLRSGAGRRRGRRPSRPGRPAARARSAARPTPATNRPLHPHARAGAGRTRRAGRLRGLRARVRHPLQGLGLRRARPGRAGRRRPRRRAPSADCHRRHRRRQPGARARRRRRGRRRDLLRRGRRRPRRGHP